MAKQGTSEPDPMDGKTSLFVPPPKGTDPPLRSPESIRLKEGPLGSQSMFRGSTGPINVLVQGGTDTSSSRHQGTSSQPSSLDTSFSRMAVDPLTGKPQLDSTGESRRDSSDHTPIILAVVTSTQGEQISFDVPSVESRGNSGPGSPLSREGTAAPVGTNPGLGTPVQFMSFFSPSQSASPCPEGFVRDNVVTGDTSTGESSSAVSGQTTLNLTSGSSGQTTLHLTSGSDESKSRSKPMAASSFPIPRAKVGSESEGSSQASTPGRGRGRHLSPSPLSSPTDQSPPLPLATIVKRELRVVRVQALSPKAQQNSGESTRNSSENTSRIHSHLSSGRSSAAASPLLLHNPGSGQSLKSPHRLSPAPSSVGNTSVQNMPAIFRVDGVNSSFNDSSGYTAASASPRSKKVGVESDSFVRSSVAVSRVGSSSPPAELPGDGPDRSPLISTLLSGESSPLNSALKKRSLSPRRTPRALGGGVSPAAKLNLDGTRSANSSGNAAPPPAVLAGSNNNSFVKKGGASTSSIVSTKPKPLVPWSTDTPFLSSPGSQQDTKPMKLNLASKRENRRSGSEPSSKTQSPTDKRSPTDKSPSGSDGAASPQAKPRKTKFAEVLEEKLQEEQRAAEDLKKKEPSFDFSRNWTFEEVVAPDAPPELLQKRSWLTTYKVKVLEEEFLLSSTKTPMVVSFCCIVVALCYVTVSYQNGYVGQGHWSGYMAIAMGTILTVVAAVNYLVVKNCEQVMADKAGGGEVSHAEVRRVRLRMARINEALSHLCFLLSSGITAAAYSHSELCYQRNLALGRPARDSYNMCIQGLYPHSLTIQSFPLIALEFARANFAIPGVIFPVVLLFSCRALAPVDTIEELCLKILCNCVMTSGIVVYLGMWNNGRRRHFESQLSVIRHYRRLDKRRNALDETLKVLLPPGITEKLMSGKPFDISIKCTFTVSRIDDFTAWSCTLMPTALVHALDNLFCLFDEAVTAKFNLTKLKVVGDIYIVSDGLQNEQTNDLAASGNEKGSPGAKISTALGGNNQSPGPRHRQGSMTKNYTFPAQKEEDAAQDNGANDTLSGTWNRDRRDSLAVEEEVINHSSIPSVRFALWQTRTTRRLGTLLQIKFSLSVALHTGPCFGGILGVDSLWYEFYGEAFEVAAELVQRAKGGEVLSTQETMECCAAEPGAKERFEGTPTEVYELSSYDGPTFSVKASTRRKQPDASAQVLGSPLPFKRTSSLDNLDERGSPNRMGPQARRRFLSNRRRLGSMQGPTSLQSPGQGSLGGQEDDARSEASDTVAGPGASGTSAATLPFAADSQTSLDSANVPAENDKRQEAVRHMILVDRVRKSRRGKQAINQRSAMLEQEDQGYQSPMGKKQTGFRFISAAESSTVSHEQDPFALLQSPGASLHSAKAMSKGDKSGSGVSGAGQSGSGSQGARAGSSSNADPLIPVAKGGSSTALPTGHHHSTATVGSGDQGDRVAPFFGLEEADLLRLKVQELDPRTLCFKDPWTEAEYMYRSTRSAHHLQQTQLWPMLTMWNSLILFICSVEGTLTAVASVMMISNLLMTLAFMTVCTKVGSTLSRCWDVAVVFTWATCNLSCIHFLHEGVLNGEPAFIFSFVGMMTLHCLMRVRWYWHFFCTVCYFCVFMVIVELREPTNRLGSTTIVGALFTMFTPVSSYFWDKRRREHFRDKLIGEVFGEAADNEDELQTAMLDMLVPPTIVDIVQAKSLKERDSLIESLGEVSVLVIRFDQFSELLGSAGMVVDSQANSPPRPNVLQSPTGGSKKRNLKKLTESEIRALVNEDDEEAGEGKQGSFGSQQHQQKADGNNVWGGNPQAVLRMMESLFGAIEQAIAKQASENTLRNIEKVYTLGDRVLVAGPLLEHTQEQSQQDQDLMAQSNMKAVRSSAPKLKSRSKSAKVLATQRMLEQEDVVLKSSLSLFDVLTDLRESVGGFVSFSAVLHSGEAFAAVLGVQRPVFTLLGPVTRTAEALLDSAPPQFKGVTHAYKRLLHNGRVEMPRREYTWAKSGPNWKVHGAGVIRMYPLVPYSWAYSNNSAWEASMGPNALASRSNAAMGVSGGLYPSMSGGNSLLALLNSAVPPPNLDSMLVEVDDEPDSPLGGRPPRASSPFSGMGRPKGTTTSIESSKRTSIDGDRDFFPNRSGRVPRLLDASGDTPDGSSHIPKDSLQLQHKATMDRLADQASGSYEV